VLVIHDSSAAPAAPAKKPFADLSAPVYDNAPIDAAITATDDYLPLKKEASNPRRTNNLNNNSVEEAVLKRSHMGHKH
jgi:hypothetical protein